MKKHIILAGLLVAFAGFQIFINCSDPLERSDIKGPFPSGPIHDVDTVFSVDTIFVTDTLSYVDTVVVIQPDTSGSPWVCSRIESNKREIVWMFRNEEGLLLLEFAASLESDHPRQILTLDIDGQEYTWNPAEKPELIKELDLGQNMTIKITPKKPPSLGHAIDVCLTVSTP